MEARLNDLEHPVIVFIDTTEFVAANFDFGASLFKALLDRCQSGDIQLVVPEITHREVKSRIQVSVLEAKRALATFKKKGRVLRTLPQHPLHAIFADIDWAEMCRLIETQFDEFLKASAAEILPLEGDDVKTVFDDYFDQHPPFGEGKKKHEFPDAFAVKSLIRYANEKSRPVVIVSHDQDLESACDNSDHLIFCDSLRSVLEKSLALRPLSTEEIRAMLETHRKPVEKKIIESFRDRGFFWDDEEAPNNEIEETFDEEVNVWDWSIVNQDQDWVEVEGDVLITFYAHACYPDPDMSYWDKEDQTLISFGSETARVAASVDVPVRFRLNTSDLRDGRLALDDLEVNRHDDVWFTGEIEEIL